MKLQRAFQVLIVTGVLGFLPAVAVAATWVVKPDRTGDFPTIQDAITGCGNGDRILLTNGTFTGDGNRDIHFPAGRAVVIEALDGPPSACVIDCQGSHTDYHRAFTYDDPLGSVSALRGFTIRNGYVLGPYDWTDLSQNGGAVLIENGAHPLFEDMVFEHNIATVGAAFAIQGSGATFRRCLFVGNLAGDGFAGVLVVYGELSFEDCVFRENDGYQGSGGIASGWSELLVQGCRFEDNISTGGGTGGITFSGGHAEVRECTFVHNGYPAVSVGGPGLIDQCTFVDNVGYTEEYSTVVLYDPSSLVISNSIIAFNTGSAVWCAGAAAPTLTCCDVFGNSGENWSGCIGDQYGQEGNISLDPLFCAVGADDYHLDMRSPCAPNSPVHPECSLVGALPVACPAASVTEPETPAAPGYLLGPAMPNPTRGGVSFRLTLPPGTAGSTDSRIELGVFDASGRLIRGLRLPTSVPGAEILRWDGRDEHGVPVSGGVYFLRLIGGGERYGAGTRAERIVVVK